MRQFAVSYPHIGKVAVNIRSHTGRVAVFNFHHFESLFVESRRYVIRPTVYSLNYRSPDPCSPTIQA